MHTHLSKGNSTFTIQPRLGWDQNQMEIRSSFVQIIVNSLRTCPDQTGPPRFTQTGITTIRFEGIDALETHFSVEGDEYHQEMDLALEARDALLEEAGFGRIEYFDDKPFKVRAVENHPIRGYLLSNGLDTYGRTIAFVYTGDLNQVDGPGYGLNPRC